MVDRTPLEPPPIIVAVVGPPKVGKSLLIRCLIKTFTRQPLNNIKGPITIVSGKYGFTLTFNISNEGRINYKLCISTLLPSV